MELNLCKVEEITKKTRQIKHRIVEFGRTDIDSAVVELCASACPSGHDAKKNVL
jgi:hypothetical protein